MNSPRPNDFFSRDTACRRCGTCCRRGGPILHAQDLDLVDDIRLARQDLVCLRQGEIATDPFTGALIRLESEHLKVRGADPDRGGWRCVFFSQAGCALHPLKPLQCRLLDCADPSALARALQGEKLLERRDVIVPGSALAELVRLHGDAFAAGPPLDSLLADLASGASGPAALARLAGLIKDEDAFRSGFMDRTGAKPPFLDFLFGRPLARLLADAATLGPAQAARLVSRD